MQRTLQRELKVLEAVRCLMVPVVRPGNKGACSLQVGYPGRWIRPLAGASLALFGQSIRREHARAKEPVLALAALDALVPMLRLCVRMPP